MIEDEEDTELPPLVEISDKEKVRIYNDFLIDLHTARWTHSPSFGVLMDKLAAYSYSRTNSNGYWDEEERNQQYTLLALERK